MSRMFCLVVAASAACLTLSSVEAWAAEAIAACAEALVATTSSSPWPTVATGASRFCLM